MLFPSRPSVRPWTAVFVLVALGWFGSSRTWADDEVFELDDKMMAAFKALVFAPRRTIFRPSAGCWPPIPATTPIRMMWTALRTS